MSYQRLASARNQSLGSSSREANSLAIRSRWAASAMAGNSAASMPANCSTRLDIASRKTWRISANLAVSDHNVPTTDRSHGIADPISRLQVETLDRNCDRFGITQFKMNDKRQGIVHVIGPEQGATLPGMTVVCGDSHTSTHGAFGALAHGIGTSEVEHVLATQTLLAKKAKNMLVKVEGTLPRGCTAKDIVLAVIGKIGTAGGTGYTIEFGGAAIRALSMEGRMTVCNMAIEAGARAGLVAVDDITINYVKVIAPGSTVHITGLGGRAPQSPAKLFMGNAGTAMRPLTAAHSGF